MLDKIEVFVAQEHDGSQWVSLDDYNKIKLQKDELRGALYSMIALIDKHGDKTIKAHARQIEQARKSLE